MTELSKRGDDSLKAVPIGIDDFKKMRDEEFYYVDKTPLIDHILKKKAEVSLFTRPRRFGKTLNMSMIDAYLNERYAGNHWFDDLAISTIRPDDPEKNGNVVVSISMKDMGDGSYSAFITEFTKKMSNLYSGFPELKNSPRVREALLTRYDRIVSGEPDDGDLTTCIYDLCSMLESHHGKKVVLIIDEYDNPVNNSSRNRQSIMNFLRTLYGSALKGNDSLRFSVMTGIMQFAKEGIFSGVNNVYVNSILSNSYNESFGFTSAEVETMCSDYGRADAFDEVRMWYDGYRFGNMDIYNPWSVLSYVMDCFVAKPYWAGTSGNEIIGRLLRQADSSTMNKLVKLSAGESIDVMMEDSITYSDLTEGRRVFAVMAMSGYLKAEKKGMEPMKYSLMIPNIEVSFIFSSKIVDMIHGNPEDDALNRFVDALEADRPDEMASCLQEILVSDYSSRVLTHEKVYQCFVSGMLASIRWKYDIRIDYEAGFGYYDIRLEPKMPGYRATVIEIKRIRSNAKDETMEKTARKALDQIADRQYASGLNGEILAVGLVFSGKRAKAVTKMMR